MKISAGGHERNAREHFGVGTAIVLLAAALTYFLRDTDLMKRLEMLNMDAWVSFQTPQATPPIIVVEITDEDYSAQFAATSPLSPAKVSLLLKAVAHSRPAAIGIDLDTASWTAVQRNQLREELVTAGDKEGGRRIPLVWAIGGQGSPDSLELDEPISSIGSKDCFAAPAMSEDRDGVVREYFTGVVSEGRRWPGFAKAMLEAEQRPGDCATFGDAASGAGPEPLSINFRGGRAAFDHITASTVIGAAFTQPWEADNPLRGRMVLVGGTYRAGRDRYLTPLGVMAGVDILGHSIRSSLPGGEIRAVPESLFLMVDVAIGLALVVLTWFVPEPWDLPLVFIAVPLIAFIASLLTYNTTSYFASFMPVLGGIVLHELFEHVVNHQRMKRELRKLRSVRGVQVEVP